MTKIGNPLPYQYDVTIKNKYKRESEVNKQGNNLFELSLYKEISIITVIIIQGTVIKRVSEK